MRKGGSYESTGVKWKIWNGHEMAANAICEQFRKLDKDTEIVKKDLLEELYPHISKLIFGGISSDGGALPRNI